MNKYTYERLSSYYILVINIDISGKIAFIRVYKVYNVLFFIHIDSVRFRFYNVVSETKRYFVIKQKTFRSVPRVPRR